jgi:Mg2+/Co2+ transporter CorB
MQYIAYPFVFFLNSITNTLLKVFGVSLENQALNSLSADELRTVVKEAGGLIPSKHQNMLISILDLESIKVEDIMIPRNEVQGVDISEDWDDIRSQIVNAPFTRMPVYEENLDNIIGFIHLRKIFPRIVQNEMTLEELRAESRAPYFIPESTSLNRQLLNFQHEKRRIGLVVDEYGDIQGLVTLEDLLEEIVGEFTNDPATYNTDIHPQDDGSYVIDASTHVRDVNKTLKLTLNTNGPRTLNGLMLEHLETIPEKGTTVLIDGHPIEIVHMLNNSIRTVRIMPQVNKKTLR